MLGLNDLKINQINILSSKYEQYIQSRTRYRAKNKKKKYVYPTRNRKEYMQKYYNAHKETVQCDMCKKYFACPMSLKNHHTNNMLCLMLNIDNMLINIRNTAPEALDKIDHLIQANIAKINKLSQRKESQSEQIKKKQDLNKAI